MEEFYTYSVNRLLDSLKESKKMIKKQYNQYGYIALLIGALCGIGLGYYFYTLESYYLLVLPVAFYIILIFIVLFSVEYTSEKRLMNEYVNQEIINMYNIENDKQFEYTYNPKLSKDFNVDMGLFSRYATITTFFRIVAEIDNIKCDIRKSQFIISTGQSTQVEFEGYYIILPIEGEKTFQVRSHGKPKKHKTKFKRIMNEPIKGFTLEEDLGGIPDRFIQTIELLQREHRYKRMFLASNGEEVHIAFSPQKPIKLPKELTNESFKNYMEEYSRLFTLLDRVLNLLVIKY